MFAINVIVPLNVSSPPPEGYQHPLADVDKFVCEVWLQDCTLIVIDLLVSATKHWKLNPPLIYAPEHIPPPADANIGVNGRPEIDTCVLV